MKHAPQAVALALLVGLLTAGCQGRGGNTAVVQGKVTYKGAPVTGGQLTFHSPTAGPVPGPINPDGTFSFGGLTPGELKVTVETESIRNSASMDYTKMMKPPGGMAEPTTPRPVYVMVPAKYASETTTSLKVTIKPGTNANLNLDLTD